MQSKRFWQSIVTTVALFTICVLSAIAAHASTTKIVYRFAGGSGGEHIDSDRVTAGRRLLRHDCAWRHYQRRHHL